MATISSLINIDENLCVERNAGDLIIESGQQHSSFQASSLPGIPRLEGKSGLEGSCRSPMTVDC